MNDKELVIGQVSITNYNMEMSSKEFVKGVEVEDLREYQDEGCLIKCYYCDRPIRVDGSPRDIENTDHCSSCTDAAVRNITEMLDEY